MIQDKNKGGDKDKGNKLFSDGMFDDIPNEDETTNPGSPSHVEQDEMYRQLRNRLDMGVLTYLDSTSGKYIRIYKEDYTILKFTERAVILQENDSGIEAIIPISQMRVDEKSRFYIRAWILAQKFPE